MTSYINYDKSFFINCIIQNIIFSFHFKIKNLTFPRVTISPIFFRKSRRLAHFEIVFDKSVECENLEIDENWCLYKLIATVDCNNLSDKKKESFPINSPVYTLSVLERTYQSDRNSAYLLFFITNKCDFILGKAPYLLAYRNIR